MQALKGIKKEFNSISLVIRKKIKIISNTTKYPLEWLKLLAKHIKSWWGHGIMLTLKQMEMWNFTVFWQNIWPLNIQLPYNPAILFLRNYPSKWKHVNIKTCM